MCAAEIPNRLRPVGADAVEKVADEVGEPFHLSF
jgi:hypothetical protein